jgi:hypothetical protein
VSGSSRLLGRLSVTEGNALIPTGCWEAFCLQVVSFVSVPRNSATAVSLSAHRRAAPLCASVISRSLLGSTCLRLATSSSTEPMTTVQYLLLPDSQPDYDRIIGIMQHRVASRLECLYESSCD